MTKHISIIYNFKKKHVMNDTMKMHYVSTDRQLAGRFTRPLSEITTTMIVNN